MSDGAVLTPSQRRSPSTPANRRNGRDLPNRGPQTLIKAPNSHRVVAAPPPAKPADFV